MKYLHTYSIVLIYFTIQTYIYMDGQTEVRDIDKCVDRNVNK
jgi:hypothetical protein